MHANREGTNKSSKILNAVENIELTSRMLMCIKDVLVKGIEN